MIAQKLANRSRKAVLLGSFKSPRRVSSPLHPLSETERVMARSRLDLLEVMLAEGADCLDDVMSLRRELI
jgi:hypothetical protein